MEIEINGIKIFYERFEGEGTPVLLLHGWGASLHAMKGIHNFISACGRSVISMDLPYFGSSGMPPSDFGVFDYAQVCAKFLQELNVESVIIIGHSFGGRLGIILATDYNIVQKLVLVDSAGAKPKRGIKYRTKVFSYKIKKRLGLKVQNAGSADYKALPSEMKQVFINVVNTHLDKKMAEIKVPTLLIWGENDTQTPLYMAKRMNKLIPDSGLAILQNAGHYSYADRFHDFCSIIKAFI